MKPKPRPVLELVSGQYYRVLTTNGNVFDMVKFRGPDLTFALGTGRTLRLDIVERVARRTSQRFPCGGEVFVPIEDCYPEPIYAKQSHAA